jgi:Clp amino terminal domain, pathogenicity island component
MAPVSPNPAYYRTLGRADEIARVMNSPGVRPEHLFLALIRDRRSVPARALAGLVDLGEVEAAVLDVMNSPGFRGFKNSFSEDELLLPEGQELDSALIGAIQRSLPEGTSLGFNWRADDGRPWIRVTRPGNPRAALGAALARLGRPPLP